MDVGGWLRGLGLGQYEEQFRDNKIDADLLPRLTVDDLKDIGVSVVGDRRRLLDAIAVIAGAKPPADVPASPSKSAPLKGPEVSAERRPITVMFCDLVGSTSIAAKLDAEDWRNLVNAYLDEATEAVTGLGGHVLKRLGDGLMALFGYPQAQENDAERAVRAALAIQRALADLNSRNSSKGAPELSARTISCITILSAPGGTVAPVKIRATVPAASGAAVWPAGTRCDTGSVTVLDSDAPARSAARTAYPSMELVRMGGTSSGDTTAAASTRPSASKISTVCAPSTRRAAASKVASASAVDSIGGREAAGVVDIVGGFGLAVKGEMGSAEMRGNRSTYCSENRGSENRGSENQGSKNRRPDGRRMTPDPGSSVIGTSAGQTCTPDVHRSRAPWLRDLFFAWRPCCRSPQAR